MLARAGIVVQALGGGIAQIALDACLLPGLRINAIHTFTA